jgi:hypothetical protein
MVRLFGLVVVLAPPPVYAPNVRAQNGPTEPFVALPPCYFNAYSERDDLIIGALVYHFETGTGCSQNLHRVFPVASVSKLFVAGALFQAVAEGRATFKTERLFTADYWMGGRLDCLNEAAIGQSFSLGYLGNIMISCSDNAATALLVDYLGAQAVQAYIDSFGLADIGAVLAYNEVDRLKLTFLDPRWAEVPTGMASRFYRQRDGAGLVPRYFDSLPRYSPHDLARANAEYLTRYTYNTASPYALGVFLHRLRQDYLGRDALKRQVAQWLFNTLLLTPRLYSSQSMDGTLLVGGKNGFDLGYRAEVNIMLNTLDSYAPQALSILMVRHRDVTAMDVSSRFTSGEDIPAQFLLTLAPRVTRLLYPDTSFQAPPTLVKDARVRRVLVGHESALFPCYQDFLAYDTLDVLQRCWARTTLADRLPFQETLGVGLILRDLDNADVRAALVLTQPDGERRSYQAERFFREGTAIAWYHTLNQRGVWRVEVYVNLRPVFWMNLSVE